MITNETMRRLICCALTVGLTVVIGCPENLYAKDVRSSTFVGNGGDVQDLDLSVTLAAIKNLGSSLADRPVDTLCKCSEDWQENDICKIIRQMSTAEVNACRQLITKYGAQLSALADRNSKIDFSWSETSFLVQSQAQKARPADAVTQREKSKIIINRNRFYAMPPSYRVALVTHELFHLIKFPDGYVTDEQPAPPFTNGRTMLNALGAAIAMEANEQNVFDEFQALKDVSKSQKKQWLTLTTSSIRGSERATKELLKDNAGNSLTFGYSYRQSNYGLDMGVESVSYNGVLSNIEVQELMSLIRLSPHYRINPITKYLSRWNEFFVTLGLDLGYGGASYSARSSKVEKKDKSQVLSLGSSVRAYIPLARDLWVTSGFEFRQLRYEYKKLHIKTIENQSSVTVGGAYGF